MVAQTVERTEYKSLVEDETLLMWVRIPAAARGGRKNPGCAIWQKHSVISAQIGKIVPKMRK